MVIFGKASGNIEGKTEEKVQNLPITLVQMREVGKLADPNYGFIPVADATDNLGLANRVD